MILTHEEIYHISDEYFVYGGDVTKLGCAGFAKNVETAVLAKLADKLRDAERYAWLIKHAYVAKNFTTHANILEIASTDRAVPWSATWREGKYAVNDAIDAAMLASKEKT